MLSETILNIHENLLKYIFIIEFFLIIKGPHPALPLGDCFKTTLIPKPQFGNAQFYISFGVVLRHLLSKGRVWEGFLFDFYT